jgi:hypothetical protein
MPEGAAIAGLKEWYVILVLCIARSGDAKGLKKAVLQRKPCKPGLKHPEET